MRKKLLGLCVVLSLGVLTACAKGEPTGTDPESVQSVAETTTAQDVTEPASEGETVSEETTSTEPETKTVYLLSKEVFYSDGAESPSFTEYEYDDQGNMIKKTYYDETGSVGSIMEYDSYGNHIRETDYDEGSIYLDLEYKNEYDDNGHMVKTTVNYARDGALRSTMEYEYDSESNRIKEVEYDTDGDEASVIEYDDKGNMTKMVFRYEQVTGNILITTTSIEYEYDSHDNIIKQTTYTDEDTFIYVTNYEYDHDRIIKRTSYEEDGSVSSVTEYEYDFNDNLIKEVRYEEDGSEDYSIEYEYINMELAEELK